MKNSLNHFPPGRLAALEDDLEAQAEKSRNAADKPNGQRESLRERGLTASDQ